MHQNKAWTSTGGTGTSYTDTDLTNGQSYTFEVRAVNMQGAGPAARVTATPISVGDVVEPKDPDDVQALFEAPVAEAEGKRNAAAAGGRLRAGGHPVTINMFQFPPSPFGLFVLDRTP